jgi:luciferase-like monooxygenase
MKGGNRCLFGVFNLPNLARPRGAAAIPAILEEAQELDENGWDAVWIAEHHFDGYGGIISSPAALAAALTMRTWRQARRDKPWWSCHSTIRCALSRSLLRLTRSATAASNSASAAGSCQHELAGFGISEKPRHDLIARGRSLRRAGVLVASVPATEVAPWRCGLVPSRSALYLDCSLDQPRELELAGSQGFGLMINPYTRSAEEGARARSMGRLPNVVMKQRSVTPNAAQPLSPNAYSSARRSDNRRDPLRQPPS